MSDPSWPPARLRRLSASVAVLLATALTACGADADPADVSASPSESTSGSASASPSEPASESPTETESEPAGPVLEVEVEGGRVEPVAEQVDLAVGETLTITVAADRAGELHVHSEPEQTFAFGSGNERFRLVLDTPGAVDIEEHEAEALVARVLVR